MRGKIVVCALVFSGAVVSMVGSGSIVEAQRDKESALGTQRSSVGAVGASITHPEELRLIRDEYTYDGTYGYTLWKPQSTDPHDHGGQPAIRVARDPAMEPSRIDEEVERTLDEYPDELELSRQRVEVGGQSLEGVAVGPIPGATPYIEVYVPDGEEVYRLDVYGDELDGEAKELLGGLRFEEPERSIASVDVPAANSEEALYPKAGPDSELLRRAEIPGAVADGPVGGETLAPSSRTTASRSASSVPRYSEKRIYEGCWLAAS